MKINEIYIKKFKNLKNLTFNFNNHNGLSLIIGNNASGKSNFLEAICEIFSNQYQKKTTKSKNRIAYRDFSNNSITVSNEVNSTNLPKRIVVVYSGEEDRMWKKYFRSEYLKFIDDSLQSNSIDLPKMLYLNKYYWEISLLCLLASNASDNIEFVEKILGIKKVTKISFLKKNVKNLENSIIKVFVDSLKDSYTLLEFKNQFENEPELFIKLYLASTHKLFKQIKKVSISFDSGLSIVSLSEGQKKMLMVKSALEFAGQDDTLFLFDEPDSHIHLSNKSKIYNIISNPQYLSSRHIIITSHSPSLTKLFPKESIVLLESGKICEVGSTIDAAKYLADNEDIYNILFSKRDVLLVEGKSDEKYISKAIEYFKSEYPNLNFNFLRIGGTDDDDITNLISKIKINHTLKIIILVDRDEAGYNVYKKLFPLKSNKKNFKERKLVSIEKYSNNIYFLMIPNKDSTNITSEFLIEDYFNREKIIELSKAHIDLKFPINTPFKKFPNINESIKKEIIPSLVKENIPSDMEGFKTLLDKLNEIVNTN